MTEQPIGIMAQFEELKENHKALKLRCQSLESDLLQLRAVVYKPTIQPDELDRATVVHRYRKVECFIHGPAVESVSVCAQCHLQ